MSLKSENQIFSQLDTLLQNTIQVCQGKLVGHAGVQDGYDHIQKAFILPLDREDLCALYSQLGRIYRFSYMRRQQGGSTLSAIYYQHLKNWCTVTGQALHQAQSGRRGPEILATAAQMEKELQNIYQLVSQWDDDRSKGLMVLACATLGEAGETIHRVAVKKS